MMALKAADYLAEVLVRHQALRLHLLEDLAPAGVALLRGNLVEREWRGPSTRRGLRRVLRLASIAGGREGRLEPATVVDHVTPVHVQPDRWLDPTNFQALC